MTATITLPRAVIEQALEAMRCVWPTAKITLADIFKVESDLRAALAQQAEPQDAELSAALGWPGGISEPVLDRKTLLQMVAALMQDKLWEDHRVRHLWDHTLAQQAEPVEGNTLLRDFLAAAKEAGVTHLQQVEADLCSALAQQAEPVADPFNCPKCGRHDFGMHGACPACDAQQAEPVAVEDRLARHGIPKP